MASFPLSEKALVLICWEAMLTSVFKCGFLHVESDENRLSPEDRETPWLTFNLQGKDRLLHIVPAAKPLRVGMVDLFLRHLQGLPDGRMFEADGITPVVWANCQNCAWQNFVRPCETCPECGSDNVLNQDVVEEGQFERILQSLRPDETTTAPTPSAHTPPPVLPAQAEPLRNVIPPGYLMNQAPDEIAAYFRRTPYWHPWPGPSQDEALERLQEGYPHFAPVFDWLKPQLLLGKFQKEAALHLQPLLLVGPPGCGKSSFAQALAQILTGQDIQPVHLGENPPTFALTGSNTSFKMAKPGLFLQARIGREQPRPVRNPTLLLDEIDKLNLKEHNPTPALLSLLEPDSAAQFSDAFVGEVLDLSKVLCLATANSTETLPPALLSRFAMFSIPAPSPEEFAGLIVPSIYKKWQSQFLEGTFPDRLDEERLWQVADIARFESRRVAQVLTTLSVEHPDFWPRITETYLTNLNGRLPPPPPSGAPPAAPNSSSDIEW